MPTLQGGKDSLASLGARGHYAKSCTPFFPAPIPAPTPPLLGTQLLKTPLSEMGKLLPSIDLGDLSLSA